MTTTGYRAFPKFQNPRSLRRLAPEELEPLEKTEMQRSPGIVPGHSGSTVWYVRRGEGGYFVLQVELDGQPPVLVETICTFTPTWGIDAVDGMLIEDAEHLVLNEKLGVATSRLDVYGSAADVDPVAYLRTRSATVETKAAKKKWWHFWR
jgi:hypothetical protein